MDSVFSPLSPDRQVLEHCAIRTNCGLHSMRGSMMGGSPEDLGLPSPSMSASTLLFLFRNQNSVFWWSVRPFASGMPKDDCKSGAQALSTIGHVFLSAPYEVIFPIISKS